MDEFTQLRQVRQIAQFPLLTSITGVEIALLQAGGLGGPYQSIAVSDLVGWGLASGGTLRLATGEAIQWNGTLSTPVTLRAGPQGFSFSAPVYVSGNLDAVGLSIAGQPVATHSQVQDSFNFLLANSVASWNGRTGAVTLSTDDILRAGGAPADNPVFSGRVVGPTHWNPALCDDTLVTSAWVQSALCAGLWAFAGSPCFYGSPTASTPPAGDYSKRIANTMWVTDEVYTLLNSPEFAAAVAAGASGVTSFNARAGDVTLSSADITGAGGALLASPAFTGTPTAPTQAPGTSNTDLATTAFVAAAISGGAGVQLWWKNIKTDFGAVGDGVTDDSAAFLAFQTWAQAQTHGVVLVIPAGTYVVTPVTLQAPGFRGGARFYAGISDLTIIAYGATLTNFYREDPFEFDRIVNYTARIASTAVGDTTATLLNSADASKFNVNDWVAVTSLEMQGADQGFPPNWYNVDYTQIKTISGTTVTFTSALLRTHLSTFPISGPGTANPSYDWGGPATIVRMQPDWNQSVRVYGMTVSGKTNCCARKMEMIDCNFAAFVSSTNQTDTASSGQEIIFRRCVSGTGTFEVDKNIGILKFIDCTIDTLSLQSASVETLVVDGCKILTQLKGGAKNTSLKDSHIKNLLMGPTVGFAKTLLLDDCRVGSVSWSDTLHFIALSSLTFTSGTFSAPISNTSVFQQVQRIAIPGAVMYIVANAGFGGSYGNHFIITRVYEDATNIYFDTTLTAIPTFVLGGFAGAQPPNIGVHPGASVYARGCTGCLEVQMWSRQPGGKPVNSEAHRAYSNNISNTHIGAGTDKPPIWCQGALVSLTINVIRPYTGPAATMLLSPCGQFGAYVTQMATSTLAQYLVKVDTKVAGVRTVTPTAVTGNQPNDVIPVPTAGGIWFWASAVDPILLTTLTTETAVQMPIVQIDLVTDQGASALVYEALAHT
jgi:hypothetical protein